MKTFALPILIIALGVGWLLTTMNVLPGVNWVWISALGAAGLLALALGGLDRVTIVVGPILLVASFFSLLRQTGRLSAEIEVPCLVIAIGVLLLLSRVLPLREPAWLQPPAREP